MGFLFAIPFCRPFLGHGQRMSLSTKHVVDAAYVVRFVVCPPTLKLRSSAIKMLKLLSPATLQRNQGLVSVMIYTIMLMLSILLIDPVFQRYS